jgi:hypothetical protein
MIHEPIMPSSEVDPGTRYVEQAHGAVDKYRSPVTVHRPEKVIEC